MKERVYTVVVHKAKEGGYWTSVPALPGAGSQGETLEEALFMTRESIKLMIEAPTEDGEQIPEDTEATEDIRRITTTAA